MEEKTGGKLDWYGTYWGWMMETVVLAGAVIQEMEMGIAGRVIGFKVSSLGSLFCRKRTQKSTGDGILSSFDVI